MTPPDRRATRLPPWLWVGLPLAVWLVPYAARLAGEGPFERFVAGEVGFVELATALALLVACVFGVIGVRRALRVSTRSLAVWIALVALGCFYFLGEELSWGQHLAQWETPEPFRSMNEQAETNLHNTAGWMGRLFDQIPRFVLTLVAVVAGGVLPLVRARRKSVSTGLGRFIWPPVACVPAALLSVVSGFPEMIARALGRELPPLLQVPDGEMKEGFLALFLLVYLLSVAQRLRAEERSAVLASLRPAAAPAAALPASRDEATPAEHGARDAGNDGAPRRVKA